MDVSLREAARRQVVVDEDPTGKVVPRLLFSKLESETNNPPFFKRVWVVRHRLVASLSQLAPLLSKEAKQNK
jgi:hypothetical protein